MRRVKHLPSRNPTPKEQYRVVRNYLLGLDMTERAALAAAAGMSLDRLLEFMRQSGKQAAYTPHGRGFPPVLAGVLETHSNGSITRAKLRPDLFGDQR